MLFFRRRPGAPRLTAAIAAGLVAVTGGSAVALERATDPAAQAAASTALAPIGDFVPPQSAALIQLLRQPDGTTFRAHLTPASQGGLFETVQGFSVARDRSGIWRYVTGRHATGRLRLSDVAVSAGPAPAGLQPHAGRAATAVDPEAAAIRASIQRQLQIASFKAQRAATQGHEPRVFHVPAFLLATWWDADAGQTGPQFQKGHEATYFKKILDGFGGNPRGSVTQFYYEASFGQFIVKVDVFGPYTSNRSRQDRCYYGGIGGGSDDGDLDVFDEELGVGRRRRPRHGARADAAGQRRPVGRLGQVRQRRRRPGRLHDDHPLRRRHGRHRQPVLHVVARHLQATLGEGESAENAFGLPHGTLAHSGIPTNSPGVFVDRVLTIPEFASATDPLTIGVASHEMMHPLGEPDYYDTSYNSVGTGDFDIMSGGSYLGNPAGSNPAMMNPATPRLPGLADAEDRAQGPAPTTRSSRAPSTRPATTTPVSRTPTCSSCRRTRSRRGRPTKLGHTWGADDVYGLAKDKKTGKYVVEGFYVENISREVAADPIKKTDSRGAMFDRKQHGSGLVVWHFDYWRQSTTYFAHGNDAQNDPNRYQMDLEEFDQNDNTQELQLNYGRGNASDYLVGAATGITSGTRQLPPHTPVSTGKPQGPADISGTTPPTGETSTEFTVDDNPNNYTMTVTVASDNGGDCKLSLTDPDGTTGSEVDSTGPGESESLTVKQPKAGTWKANVSDFAGCGQWSGRVMFTGPGGFITSGAADTWSNWSEKPTGWAFTNVSGGGNGLDVRNESGGSENITLDVVNLAKKRDVSPGFVSGALNSDGGTGRLTAGVRNHMVVPVFSNGSRKVGRVRVVVHEGSAHGAVVAARTVRLHGYQRKDVRFDYRPRHEGPIRLVTVVDPADHIVEAEERNQVQSTSLWVGPRKPKVLIVDDDETLAHERAIAGALASLGVPYAIAATHPSAKLMSKYRAVIWEASVDRYEGQLNAADRTQLRRYLNGGGKLLISSNRVLDAVGTGQSRTTPQSTEEGVKFAAHYLGERQPAGNGTYVVTQESRSTVTGHGLLAGYKLRIAPAAARPFVGIAGLAQAGDGGLGTTIKPYGTATGVGTLDKASLAAVVPEKDTPYIGVAVDGDAKHNYFRTVTLGWNLGDDVNAADTVGVLRSVLKHFGVPQHVYRVHSAQPLVFHSPVRDQMSGRVTPITAVVLGGGKHAVRLYYRRHGQGAFYSVRMRHSGERGTYLARIPGRAVTPDGVDYYIKAGGRLDPIRAGGRLYHGIGVSMPELARPMPVLPHGA